ncbi:MAG: thioredoxin family protein [Bacillota bacterium]
MNPAWAHRALDFEQYLQEADMNVPTMRENFANTQVKPEHDAYFRSLAKRLPERSIRVLVLSEPWCGDCVENLPVLAKLESLYPFLKLHIFPRDQNLDIMDEYLTEGMAIIPVFVFFDEKGTEIGRFVERPSGAHAFMEEARQSLRSSSEATQKRGMYRARAELRRKYREGLRDETIGEIKEILLRKYAP